METFILVIIIIIIIALSLAIVYLTLKEPDSIVGGSENSELICGKTNKKLRAFLDADFTSKRITKSEKLLEDIEQTISDLTEKKVKSMNLDTLNIKSAKLILDAMLHCHIYENYPNTISKTILNNHVKKLNIILKRSICFETDHVKNLSNKIKNTIKLYAHKEIKITATQLPEIFRKYKVLALNPPSLDKNCDTLRNELSKKNIELRGCEELLEKTKVATFVGIGNIFDTCERERRLLQEKVIELRKDIENLKSTTLSPAEIQDLRNRLEECKKDYENQSNEVNKLAKDLEDCHMIVNAISTEPVV